MNNPLSLNLHTYVHNNPLIYTDSSGKCPINKDFWDFAKKAAKTGGEILWKDIKDTGDLMWSFGEAALEYAGPGTGVKTGVTYAIKNGKEIWSVTKDGVKRAAKSVEATILKRITYMSGTNTLKNFNLDDAFIKTKHLSTTKGNYAKFLVNTKAEAEAILTNAMKNGKVTNVIDNGLTKQGNQSYEIIIDAGKAMEQRERLC